MSQTPREIRSIEDYVDDTIARITAEHRIGTGIAWVQHDIRVSNASRTWLGDCITIRCSCGEEWTIDQPSSDDVWTDRQLQTITPPVLTDD